MVSNDNLTQTMLRLSLGGPEKSRDTFSPSLVCGKHKTANGRGGVDKVRTVTEANRNLIG